MEPQAANLPSKSGFLKLEEPFGGAGGVRTYLRALRFCKGEESGCRVIIGIDFSSFCVLHANSKRVSGDTNEDYDWHSGCWLEMSCGKPILSFTFLK